MNSTLPVPSVPGRAIKPVLPGRPDQDFLTTDRIFIAAQQNMSTFCIRVHPSFKYIHKNTDPNTETALRPSCLYMSDDEFTGPAAKDCVLIKDGLKMDEDVYSDDGVGTCGLGRTA